MTCIRVRKVRELPEGYCPRPSLSTGDHTPSSPLPPPSCSRAILGRTKQLRRYPSTRILYYTSVSHLAIGTRDYLARATPIENEVGGLQVRELLLLPFPSVSKYAQNGQRRFNLRLSRVEHHYAPRKHSHVRPRMVPGERSQTTRYAVHTPSKSSAANKLCI